MTQNLNILLLIPTVISVLSLGVAYYLVTWIKKQETGTSKMKEIAAAIHEGSNAFLKRQYKTIAIIAVILGALLVMLDSNTFQAGKMTLRVGWILGLAFLFGALCSGVAGLVGMWIAVRANLRTASGAQKGLSKALDVATKAGAISGITITAMSLLGISILYAFCLFVLKVEAALIPNLIAGFGFGASLVALFAQLGGGIYTKAADVGADLVGKIEQNIPEDDPRNPAVVADLVGDNVGDCAGRGADLFESTAAENIAAMILGAALMKDNPALGISVVFFPLILRAVGLICSMIGLLFAKGTDQEDPMAILNKGYYVTCFLAVLAFWGVIYMTFGSLSGWFNLFLAGLVGILASLAFVWITQYYTSSDYRPIKEIVKASRTGHATNIIAGLAVGLESTASTVIIIGVSLLMSFELGKLSGLQGPDAGIYGTAIATMGMLATAAYILTMDTFGPITDNAGGIVEMSDQPESVREVTDKLDTVGNTTKALTKGYAMGSAALSAFLLFSAYMTDSGLKTVDFAKVEVFVGAMVGGMLVFLFSALAMKAVGNAAGSIVEEVRRQFKENPGLMAGTQKPDYGKCVDITTLAALKEMVVPGVLAVIVPILIGYFFKAEAAGGLIMAGTIVGVLMATMMNNAGGAWDNAKKYIEKGHEGGKGSPTHAASVTGDTVGDPFKDTAGPSLHVLVKLLGTLSLALVAVFK